MIKHTANIKTSIFNLIKLFNSVGKLTGFSVTKCDDSLFSKILQEVVFSVLSLFALYCTIRAEIWCVKFLDMDLDVKKLVIFVVNQLVILLPLSCLLYYRPCDLPIWKIILKVKHLEENLIYCDIYLEIRRIGFIGLFFWFFQFFNILGMMYYTLWPTLVFFLVDAICLFYFEAWVTIPYLQFLGWVCFLCYVSCQVQHNIVDINKLEYLADSDLCRVQNRFARMTWEGYESDRVKQIKRIIGLMKQVLNIANELSAAYGITVLIYVVSYVSRIIIHFYDLIDKDAQKFPMWVSGWNIIARIIFILPLFISCERLTYNVNETVKLIEEIVTLYQPSCLDCIFQSLTLRLQHQSTTIQICGFLNVTYSSFLTIMTTALAFLLFQLQF